MNRWLIIGRRLSGENILVVYTVGKYILEKTYKERCT
jgi:hypothetical protein